MARLAASAVEGVNYTLTEFRQAYSSNDTRFLALRYLGLINNKKTQVEMREGVVWDLLLTTVKQKSNLVRKYKFDGNDDNYYYLAEDFDDLIKLDRRRGMDLFDKTLIHIGPAIYANYSSKKEFCSLLDWVMQHTETIPKYLTKQSRQDLKQCAESKN